MRKLRHFGACRQAVCERLAYVGTKRVPDAAATYYVVIPKPQAATSSCLVDTPSGRVTRAQDERRWRVFVFLAQVNCSMNAAVLYVLVVSAVQARAGFANRPA
jgi:hypothetical protein